MVLLWFLYAIKCVKGFTSLFHLSDWYSCSTVSTLMRLRKCLITENLWMVWATDWIKVYKKTASSKRKLTSYFSLLSQIRPASELAVYSPAALCFSSTMVQIWLIHLDAYDLIATNYLVASENKWKWYAVRRVRIVRRDSLAIVFSFYFYIWFICLMYISLIPLFLIVEGYNVDGLLMWATS